MNTRHDGVLGVFAFIAVSWVADPAFANDAPTLELRKTGLYLGVEQVEVTVGGRLHLDSVFAPDDFGGGETEIRRARVELGVSLPHDVRLRADYDFAPGREGVRNLWVDYRGIDGVGIRVGQFVVPFALEELMESNDLLFMDRALPGALAPGFNAGVALRASPGDWSLQGGVFFNPIDGSDPSGAGTTYVARAVYRPVDEGRRILHLGAAFEYRDLTRSAEPRYASRQELSIGRSRLDTRSIKDASGTTGVSLEAIYIDGPLLLQAQGVQRVVDAAYSSPRFEGGYIQAAWLIGKARRKYSRGSGVPLAVRPQGKFGALEIGARVSHLDLDDRAVTGGKETNFGAVANWYVNYNLRVGIDLVHAQLAPDKSGDQVNETAAQVRFQLQF
jgi:phosphate-selective porin OprO and OprP